MEVFQPLVVMLERVPTVGAMIINNAIRHGVKTMAVRGMELSVKHQRVSDLCKWLVESSPRAFLLRHTGESRYPSGLCRGSIPFFSKEGVAGSTRRGSLVPDTLSRYSLRQL